MKVHIKDICTNIVVFILLSDVAIDYTDIKDDIPMPMVYILSLYHLLNLNTGEHYCGVIIFVLIDPECLQ
jgi:hypothetical protein